ncbi:FkbM family methyltransferase [Nitrincola sp. MINF-07-Sa-05]|uniref:FkbM family methyltransferase n=1 Tax=Nitrincola salilacus TaxID=3400273 RepID=UPI0039183879
MNKQFIKMYFAENAPRYIFGATAEAKELIAIHREKNIEITAVIDNFFSGEKFSGLPCLKLNDVPSNALILSAVTNSRPIDVNNLLEKHNFNYCDYFYFYRYSGLECPKISFWEGVINHWQTYKLEYDKVKSILSDYESIKTFDSIVGFRNNYDLSYMKGFTFNIANMYIEPFLLPFKEGGVFFDLGAFDGSDSDRFLRHCPTGKAYLFEPIPSQVESLAIKYKDFSAVTVVPVAVGNASRNVSFSLSGKSSKIVDKVGGAEVVSVQQICIDEFCADNNIIPYYVKMDVEGVELDVLNGMADTIIKYKPKLAVSVYHRADHLISVPNYLKKLCPEYKFYLRHYTQGYSETVLFAV